MKSKLTELLEGFVEARKLTQEVKQAYKTVKELKALAETMPKCDARDNIHTQAASLEIMAMLDEMNIHKKMDKLIELQEQANKELKLFLHYQGEGEEFRKKMLEANAEYYYHESITPNMINQIDLSDTDTDTAISLDDAEIHSMAEKLKEQSNLYLKYEGEAEEFRGKMLEVNPEYYYHESLGSSL
jgi:hypothetical protein